MRQFFAPHVGGSHRCAGDVFANLGQAVRFAQSNKVKFLDVMTVENEGTEAERLSRAVVAVPEPSAPRVLLNAQARRADAPCFVRLDP
jgi:hypothetical protein